MTLNDFIWGGTIRSTDPNAQGHLEDANMQALFGMQGSKLGDWQWDPARNSRYIDTQYGRLYAGDQHTINFANEASIGGNESQGALSNFQALSGGNNLAPYLSGDWQNFGGASIRLGEHANNSGSDAIQGYVDENGVLQFVGMDRESPARRNAILAAIATAGIGGAVAGGVGGASGAFSAGTGAPGALGTAGVYGTSVGGTAAATGAAGAVPSAAPASSTGYMPIQTAPGINEAAGLGSAGATGVGVSSNALNAAANAGAGASLLDKILEYGGKAGDFLDSRGGALTISTLADLLGGYLGSNAAKDAAQMQLDATKLGIDEVRRQYDQTREDQMPWLEAGRGALGQLQERIPELTGRFTPDDLTNDPGYQFQLKQGLDAITAAGRAGGSLDSGATLKALMEYGQGHAGQFYSDAFNRHQAENTSIYNMLAGLSGTGQTTAQQLGSQGAGASQSIASLLGQAGNAQAAGKIGSTNSWLNVLGNTSNRLQENSWMNSLFNNRQGGGWSNFFG